MAFFRLCCLCFAFAVVAASADSTVIVETRTLVNRASLVVVGELVEEKTDVYPDSIIKDVYVLKVEETLVGPDLKGSKIYITKSRRTGATVGAKGVFFLNTFVLDQERKEDLLVAEANPLGLRFQITELGYWADGKRNNGDGVETIRKFAVERLKRDIKRYDDAAEAARKRLKELEK